MHWRSIAVFRSQSLHVFATFRHYCCRFPHTPKGCACCDQNDEHLAWCDPKSLRNHARHSDVCFAPHRKRFANAELCGVINIKHDWLGSPILLGISMGKSLSWGMPPANHASYYYMILNRCQPFLREHHGTLLTRKNIEHLWETIVSAQLSFELHWSPQLRDLYETRGLRCLAPASSRQQFWWCFASDDMSCGFQSGEFVDVYWCLLRTYPTNLVCYWIHFTIFNNERGNWAYQLDLSAHVVKVPLTFDFLGIRSHGLYQHAQIQNSWMWQWLP